MKIDKYLKGHWIPQFIELEQKENEEDEDCRRRHEYDIPYLDMVKDEETWLHVYMKYEEKHWLFVSRIFDLPFTYYFIIEDYPSLMHFLSNHSKIFECEKREWIQYENKVFKKKSFQKLNVVSACYGYYDIKGVYEDGDSVVIARNLEHTSVLPWINKNFP